MNIKGQFYWLAIDIHLLLSQYSRLYKYLQYSVHDLALIVSLENIVSSFIIRAQIYL